MGQILRKCFDLIETIFFVNTKLTNITENIFVPQNEQNTAKLSFSGIL